jgi:hypothetical protein
VCVVCGGFGDTQSCGYMMNCVTTFRLHLDDFKAILRIRKKSACSSREHFILCVIAEMVIVVLFYSTMIDSWFIEVFVQSE